MEDRRFVSGNGATSGSCPAHLLAVARPQEYGIVRA
jgi:hypothetical protein